MRTRSRWLAAARGLPPVGAPVSHRNRSRQGCRRSQEWGRAVADVPATRG